MISSELNNKIKLLAKDLTFTVSDTAPNTFKDLKECSLGNLVIWSGASDITIYGSPNINYMFRAWHDSMHLKYNIGFSIEDELVLSKLSANQFDGGFADIIYAETAGQVMYFKKYGEFPENQLQFINDYINNK